jgi:hypothetical protein
MATYIIPPIQLPHLLFMRAPAKDIIELRAPDSLSRPFTDREIRHALDTDSGSSPFIAVYSSLLAIEGLAPGQEARIYLLDTAKLSEHHVDVIQDHEAEGENEKYFVLSLIPNPLWDQITNLLTFQTLTRMRMRKSDGSSDCCSEDLRWYCDVVSRCMC